VTRVATYDACDNVMNVGLNKLAFVGLYGAEVIVPTMPFTLPQLFFVVRFRTPIDDLPKILRVRIERPNLEPFVQDNTENLAAQTLSQNPDVKFFQSQAIVRIAPFEITEPGTVRVYVEDEKGDNYAGGLRLKVGVLPELQPPQVAAAGTMVVAHYERLKSISPETLGRAAIQLLSAFAQYLTYIGIKPELQVPKADVRIQLDDRRVQVFFPKPMELVPEVTVEGGGNFESAEVISCDEIGCTILFHPSAPVDLVFQYSEKMPKKPSRQRKRK
jgi:hypothetical protein